MSLLILIPTLEELNSIVTSVGLGNLPAFLSDVSDCLGKLLYFLLLCVFIDVFSKQQIVSNKATLVKLVIFELCQA